MRSATLTIETAELFPTSSTNFVRNSSPERLECEHNMRFRYAMRISLPIEGDGVEWKPTWGNLYGGTAVIYCTLFFQLAGGYASLP
jgi:hypothetical protein